MNKNWILFHLKEALEEIETTIKDLEQDQEYCEPEYSVAITHLYHHINHAWNGRNAKENEIDNDSNFQLWRQFPTDLDMSC